MTPLELVREVSRTFGQELDDRMCEAILWSETTFPMTRIHSNDALEVEDDFRKQLIDFFESGTEPGQRLDETIEELRRVGKWVINGDPYCTKEMVRLRTQRGASVCIDEECSLSGGYAHVGPCEPCTCGMEHAIAECPGERHLTW